MDYLSHDKELLAMKYDLIKFIVHLLGSKPFVIYTDHASLRTATRSPHPSQRMSRWLSFFAEHNFEVKYNPGKQNALTDALSRSPGYELSHAMTLSSSITDFIRKAYAKDEQCETLLHALWKRGAYRIRHRIVGTLTCKATSIFHRSRPVVLLHVYGG